MNELSPDACAKEARAAWRAEVRRILSPGQRDPLLAVVMVTGLLAALGISWHVGLGFEARSSGFVGASALATLAIGALIGALVSVARLTRRRIENEAEQARERARPARCPRCAEDVALVSLTCAACGARVLSAEGLLIVQLHDEALRQARWRAAARHRLRHVRPTLALAPPLWLGAVVVTIALIVGGARSLGGIGAAPMAAPMAASLGEPREIPDDGVARARGFGTEGQSPVAPPTRQRAPLLVGTQVLAQMGRGPYHELAVIVRVRERAAFVVYADGDSAWVDGREILAPEIAAADAVEMFDGARFVPGTIRARMGSALLVDGAWSSMSRMRVRSDGAHVALEGRTSEVPADAWVEVRVGEAWRPGIAVDSIELRQRVVLGHGTDRWFDHASVRPQQLGPGARVWVDGREGEQIIAARIGHALAIVGPDGARGWTALARVRRR